MSEIPKPGPEKELQIEREPAPVTDKLLVGIIQSNEFQSRIKRAGKFIRETGFEPRFAVLCDIFNSSKLFYTPFQAQEEPSMGTLSIEKNFEKANNKGFSAAYFLIDLHIHHPLGESKPIVPSPSDLDSFSESKYDIRGKLVNRYRDEGFEFRVYPIEMIGAVDFKGNCSLLIFQEQFNQRLSELPATTEVLEISIDQVRNQQEVLDILRENNYKAETIQISEDGQISEEDQDKIRNFAFQPKIIKERWQDEE